MKRNISKYLVNGFQPVDDINGEATGVMDRLLFGDNQFFGVNHMSEEKARAQAMRFQNFGAVIDVLDAAYEAGIQTFMCTTHQRVGEIAQHVRENPHKYTNFRFYPCMPYAHKYANAVTDVGVIGLFKKFSPEGALISTAIRSGMSIAGRDVDELTRILIDSEMQMFRGVSTPVIFLQNVVVDFLMGIGLTRTFKVFAEHVRSKYGAEPGWITMNLPKLLEVLDEQGIENPIVCSNINKLGFRMSGGLPAYRAALYNRKFRGIAMSVFASGAIPAREAISWVCEQPNIESIVFGASSSVNIKNTRDLVNGFWRTA